MSRKKLDITNIILDSFGKRLNYLRIMNNYILDFVSDKTNVAKSTLSQLENDKYGPSAIALFQLSKLFNVDPYWLLTGEGDMHTPPAVPQTYPPELSDYLEKTIKVLQSETDYAKALGQNIDAFYKSVTAEETKNNAIDARLSNLENKIDNLLHAKDDAGTG